MASKVHPPEQLINNRALDKSLTDIRNCLDDVESDLGHEVRLAEIRELKDRRIEDVFSTDVLGALEKETDGGTAGVRAHAGLLAGYAFDLLEDRVTPLQKVWEAAEELDFEETWNSYFDNADDALDAPADDECPF